MLIILIVLALAAVEAGRYGAPQMAPSYRPSYRPQPAPSWPIPWWIYGRRHHHRWSDSWEHHRPRHHHHHRSPAQPSACSRCPQLGRVYDGNSKTMASIQYIEQSNGCKQVILGCPISNASHLFVKQRDSTNITTIAYGVGVKVLLECTRERKWTPYTVKGMDVVAVGCNGMGADLTEQLLNLNFTQPAPIKQKRHANVDYEQEALLWKESLTALKPFHYGNGEIWPDEEYLEYGDYY